MDESNEINKNKGKNNSDKIELEKKYEEELENLNIFNLIKSDSLIDKKQVLELLTKNFNQFDSLLDKYETLIKILSRIIPMLF